jgi:hypothetical protein
MVLHRGEFIVDNSGEEVRVAGEFQAVAGDYDLIAMMFVTLQIFIRCLVISMKYGTISERLFAHKKNV